MCQLDMEEHLLDGQKLLPVSAGVGLRGVPALGFRLLGFRSFYLPPSRFFLAGGRGG